MAAADTQHPGSPGGITKITFISVMWNHQQQITGRGPVRALSAGSGYPQPDEIMRFIDIPWLYRCTQGVKTGEGGGWYLDHPPPGAGIKLCLN